MRKLGYTFLLFSFFSINLLAQKQDSTLLRQLAGKVYNDGIDYVTSPFHWNKKDWLIAGGTSVVTAASIFYFDKPVSNFVNEHQYNSVHNALSIFEYSDNILSPLVMGGFALHGAIKKDNYSMQTAIIVAQSYVFNGIMVQAVKTIAGRQRPYNSPGDPLNWKPFSGGSSFYSGHTSTSFAVASVVAYRYRDVKWVPWVSYGLATLTGIQRIYYNKHWTSDVLMGAVAGTATGIFLSKAWENSSIQFYPQFGTEMNGISLVIKIK